MLRLAAAAVVAGALATGCTGSPAPTPSTPTPLSDDEAFAAAEATYRAYVDALNQVDLSDPETFEPVYALTTGDANANERQSLSTMSADGWSVAGATKVLAFKGESVNKANREDLRLTAVACTDVSEVSVVDQNGVSVVPSDRPSRYALRLTFEGSLDRLLISSSNAIREPSCVGS